MKEKRKRNKLPSKKKPHFSDIMYEKSKKLAKRLNVPFIKDGQTWSDVR